MTRFHTLSFVALFGLSTLAGCSAFNGDDDNDRDGRRGDVQRDSGSAKRVPRDAQVVDRGSGGNNNTLSFTARNRGTVYLEDSTAGVVVWDQSVRDGDRVTVTPDKNRIEVNGKAKADLDLKSDHRFQLYFMDSDRR